MASTVRPRIDALTFQSTPRVSNTATTSLASTLSQATAPAKAITANRVLTGAGGCWEEVVVHSSTTLSTALPAAYSATHGTWCELICTVLVRPSKLFTHMTENSRQKGKGDSTDSHRLVALHWRLVEGTVSHRSTEKGSSSTYCSLTPTPASLGQVRPSKTSASPSSAAALSSTRGVEYISRLLSRSCLFSLRVERTTTQTYPQYSTRNMMLSYRYIFKSMHTPTMTAKAMT
mmetsp:Transcript_49252/g.96613  ORF Transcript_49252/g.96613 Transcript_49252/m.96613 type:complete len:232 (+) Transcript_49252:522-1217(+)